MKNEKKVTFTSSETQIEVRQDRDGKAMISLIDCSIVLNTTPQTLNPEKIASISFDNQDDFKIFIDIVNKGYELFEKGEFNGNNKIALRFPEKK